MLKRYLITLGAGTTAGGKVTAARSFTAVNSVKVALEGDKVWCPIAIPTAHGFIAYAGTTRTWRD